MRIDGKDHQVRRSCGNPRNGRLGSGVISNLHPLHDRSLIPMPMDSEITALLIINGKDVVPRISVSVRMAETVSALRVGTDRDRYNLKHDLQTGSTTSNPRSGIGVGTMRLPLGCTCI